MKTLLTLAIAMSLNATAAVPVHLDIVHLNQLKQDKNNALWHDQQGNTYQYQGTQTQKNGFTTEQRDCSKINLKKDLHATIDRTQCKLMRLNEKKR